MASASVQILVTLLQVNSRDSADAAGNRRKPREERIELINYMYRSAFSRARPWCLVAVAWAILIASQSYCGTGMIHYDNEHNTLVFLEQGFAAFMSLKTLPPTRHRTRPVPPKIAFPTFFTYSLVALFLPSQRTSNGKQYRIHIIMDSQPPDSAFPAAFSAHTSRITRVCIP
jgi:hypothetical protein